MALSAKDLKGAIIHFLNSDAPLLCKSETNGKQLCKTLREAHVLFNTVKSRKPARKLFPIAPKYKKV